MYSALAGEPVMIHFRGIAGCVLRCQDADSLEYLLPRCALVAVCIPARYLMSCRDVWVSSFKNSTPSWFKRTTYRMATAGISNTAP